MASAHIIMLITIGIYLAGMVAIGIYCSKDNETVGDFYLGGRKMGPIVTAMSAEAADMSSWLLIHLQNSPFTLPQILQFRYMEGFYISEHNPAQNLPQIHQEY